MSKLPKLCFINLDSFEPKSSEMVKFEINTDSALAGLIAHFHAATQSSPFSYICSLRKSCLTCGRNAKTWEDLNMPWRKLTRFTVRSIQNFPRDSANKIRTSPKQSRMPQAWKTETTRLIHSNQRHSQPSLGRQATLSAHTSPIWQTRPRTRCGQSNAKFCCQIKSPPARLKATAGNNPTTKPPTVGNSFCRRGGKPKEHADRERREGKGGRKRRRNERSIRMTRRRIQGIQGNINSSPQVWRCRLWSVSERWKSCRSITLKHHPFSPGGWKL